MKWKGTTLLLIVVLVALLFSGQFRARAKVFFNKHFQCFPRNCSSERIASERGTVISRFEYAQHIRPS